ncbi:MAG: hypothetical protein F6K09_10300 [Merismopedia sp. SIO2A8]|nr:hypothetical protein [Symploca sp. SIO2B6]NET49095.1 hypothetical protein [Merismopedia sp. SIO2A8]
MPRGGKRPGAGGKPTWKHGKTRTIRVPIALADEILAFARNLDEGCIIEHDTDSKVVDLSGISIRHHEGAIAVRLEDLARAGFEIRPEKVSQLVKARIQKLSIDEKLKDGNNKERRGRNRILYH